MKIGGRTASAASKFVTPTSTKADRLRANGLVNMRMRRGQFVKPKQCSKCGQEARLDFHHPDYGSPDEGLFLCRSCHMRGHIDPSTLDGLALVIITGKSPRHPRIRPFSPGTAPQALREAGYQPEVRNA